MARRVARPLLYLGIVAAVLGLAKVHAKYIGEYVLHSTEPSRLAWTFAYVAILMVTSYGSGLPDLTRTRRQALTSAAIAPFSAALVISLVQLGTGDVLLPRFVVLGSALLLVPWNLFCVAIARGGRLREERRDRVVLVAPGAEALALTDELDDHPEQPATLVAALSLEEAAVTSPKRKPLCDAVLEHRATVIVLDRTALSEVSILSQAAALHESGLRVRTLSMFYEQWLGKLPMSELERVSLLFDIRELHGPRYGRLKRVFDIVCGTGGLVVLVLMTPFVAVGNLIGNRGPFFYRQPRVGKNGRPIEVLKFRTMRATTDETADWTQRDDPRITPFGRALRKTHLDELPQVVGVLRGDLSIVGPRPEQPRYVMELSEKLPFYSLRHLVRPGLTGWAQVKYGYAGDEQDALEKLQYDFYYLRHQDLWFDLRITGRTIRSIVGGRGGGR